MAAAHCTRGPRDRDRSATRRPNDTRSFAERDAVELVEHCFVGAFADAVGLRALGLGCYGTSFDRRVRNLGIVQVRTPFRSPRANAIAERWVIPLLERVDSCCLEAIPRGRRL